MKPTTLSELPAIPPTHPPKLLWLVVQLQGDGGRAGAAAPAPHLKAVPVLAVVPRLLPAHSPLGARVLHRVQLDLPVWQVRQGGRGAGLGRDKGTTRRLDSSVSRACFRGASAAANMAVPQGSTPGQYPWTVPQGSTPGNAMHRPTKRQVGRTQSARCLRVRKLPTEDGCFPEEQWR